MDSRTAQTKQQYSDDHSVLPQCTIEMGWASKPNHVYLQMAPTIPKHANVCVLTHCLLFIQTSLYVQSKSVIVIVTIQHTRKPFTLHTKVHTVLVHLHT